MAPITQEMENAKNVNHHVKHARSQLQSAKHVLKDISSMDLNALTAQNIAENAQDQQLALSVQKDST